MNFNLLPIDIKEYIYNIIIDDYKKKYRGYFVLLISSLTNKENNKICSNLISLHNLSNVYCSNCYRKPAVVFPLKHKYYGGECRFCWDYN